ncbi:hypothetical protein FQN57_000712 [Myotisia sp. PD_48]|nr:hypothetical protein FQN57_000712 [Myotisia sp. PD_48]
MGDQQNISQILAALAAVRPAALQIPQSAPQQTSNHGGFSLPPPDNTGNLGMSGANTSGSGPVSIADAIAKARGFAAEKGIAYHPGHVASRSVDSRSYRRSRSPSRTPPRATRDVFRDGYNPYRDERRPDRRSGGGDRGYGRERSFSPPAGRNADTYSSPPPRHYRNPGDRSPGRRAGIEDNSETIDIDTKLVGMVIGRQGENLRRIESESGTRIQFLDSPEYNKRIRLCTITGHKSARESAKAEINRVIDEGNTSSRSAGARVFEPSGHSNHDGGGNSRFADEENSMQIMVPDRTVGLIIGRAGETIKDLQERSGCRVNIVNEDRSVAGQVPVNLMGPARAMQHAKELILEIVESDSRSSGAQPSREPRGQDTALGPTDKINDKLFIPKESVGMIIGKGGDTIKEMQSITGCKINILPPSGRDPDREVTLYGSASAIEEAKRAIKEKLDNAQKNRGPGGRREDSHNRYQQYQYPQQQQEQSQSQQYPQDSNSPSAQQQQPMQMGAGDGTDPYAMYGGYENYMAMWYAAMAQQHQQQQQQQQHQQHQQDGPPPPAPGSEQPGPPGVS